MSGRDDSCGRPWGSGCFVSGGGWHEGGVICIFNSVAGRWVDGKRWSMGFFWA